jgi:hypothetical protein
MRRSINFLGSVAAAALMVAAPTAQAQTIVGSFNAVGSVNLGLVSGNYTVTPTSPLISVPSLTGIFAPLGVTLGTIAPVVVGSGPTNIPSFISIGGYTFSLLDVAPGSFGSAQCTLPKAPGQTCTPLGTGMNLSNVSNGKGGINSSAAFSFDGTVTTPSNQTFNYTGVWTSQIAGKSYQQLNASIGRTGSAPLSYSLNIVATSVPEPATVSLMGTGLLTLVGLGYARRRKSA